MSSSAISEYLGTALMWAVVASLVGLYVWEAIRPIVDRRRGRRGYALLRNLFAYAAWAMCLVVLGCVVYLLTLSFEWLTGTTLTSWSAPVLSLLVYLGAGVVASWYAVEELARVVRRKHTGPDFQPRSKWRMVLGLSLGPAVAVAVLIEISAFLDDFPSLPFFGALGVFVLAACGLLYVLRKPARDHDWRCRLCGHINPGDVTRCGNPACADHFTATRGHAASDLHHPRVSRELMETQQPESGEPEANPLAGLEAPDELTPQPGPHMLVVSNEPSVRTGIDFLFRNRYRVKFADGNEDALAFLETSPPRLDIVLLHLHRSYDIEGIILMREARRLRPDLPIVVLSIYGAGMIHDLAMNYGAYACLKLPYDTGELLSLTGKALEEGASHHAVPDRADDNLSLFLDSLTDYMERTDKR